LWSLVVAVVVVTVVVMAAVAAAPVVLKPELDFLYLEVYQSLLVPVVEEVMVQVQHLLEELMDQTQYFPQ
jgi:hypothetical protein